MNSETKAAIIGAVVSAVISGTISIWSIKRVEHLETVNRTFQQQLEDKSISRTLASNRASQISEVAIDILRNYGDVTAVKNMSSIEWYRLNSYKNMLKALGADDSEIKLEHFYQQTSKGRTNGNLDPGRPGRDKYYENLEALTLSLRTTIDELYAVR